MPSNLLTASPSGVFPQLAYTQFSESRGYPMLWQLQHDGTIIRSIITDGVNTPVSVRSWTVAVKLRSSDLVTLRTFYNSQGGGYGRWFFYDPWHSSSIAQNYDPTGSSTAGRYTCMFLTQAWNEQTGMGSIGNLASLSFMQVA
jgi:hypothetical protein